MKIFAILAACALLAPTTFARQGVPDGSDWIFPDGTTCTVDVVDTTSGNGSVTVQITDATGSTPATPAAEGADSTTDRPTCESAPARSTTGGNTLRIKGNMPKKSKVQKLNSSGQWVSGRLTRRKMTGLGQPLHMEPDYTGPGNVGSLPVAPKGP